MDSSLPQAAEPLFTALELRENYKNKITNVLRIRGPHIARLTSPSADLIAVHTLGVDPTVDGKTFPPNRMVHITKGVEVAVMDGSTVDLLYIAVKSSKDT